MQQLLEQIRSAEVTGKFVHECPLDLYSEQSQRPEERGEELWLLIDSPADVEDDNLRRRAAIIHKTAVDIVRVAEKVNVCPRPKHLATCLCWVESVTSEVTAEIRTLGALTVVNPRDLETITIGRRAGATVQLSNVQTSTDHMVLSWQSTSFRTYISHLLSLAPTGQGPLHVIRYDTLQDSEANRALEAPSLTLMDRSLNGSYVDSSDACDKRVPKGQKWKMNLASPFYACQSTCHDGRTRYVARFRLSFLQADSVLLRLLRFMETARDSSRRSASTSALEDFIGIASDFAPRSVTSVAQHVPRRTSVGEGQLGAVLVDENRRLQQELQRARAEADNSHSTLRKAVAAEKARFSEELRAARVSARKELEELQNVIMEVRLDAKREVQRLEAANTALIEEVNQARENREEGLMVTQEAVRKAIGWLEETEGVLRPLLEGPQLFRMGSADNVAEEQGTEPGGTQPETSDSEEIKLSASLRSGVKRNVKSASTERSVRRF